MQNAEKIAGIEDTKGRILTPFQHALVKDLLEQRELLFQMSRLHQGPVHLILPQIMDENIARMQDFFAQYDFETTIHYTMKPNKSDVFARQAFKNGINIDVSSLAELHAALGAGFRGAQIGCTNTKNRQYLWLALQQGCLISVDNRLELDWIAEMAPQRRLKEEPVRILLRIADLKPLDRQFKAKPSKFGIPITQLPDIYDILHKSSDVSLEGFHFHNDNRLGDLQGAYIEHVLRLMEDAHAEGFEPTIINIGGGLRDRLLEDPNEWSAFLELLEHSLVHSEPLPTWHDYAYGMYVNDKGKISGRARVQGFMSPPPYNSFLKDALGYDRADGRQVCEIISENLFSLMTEPGYALLHQAGMTLLPVKGGKKDAEGHRLVMVDTNIYNLSVWNKEPFSDPFLIPRNDNTDAGAAGSFFLIDNICNEKGVLWRRKILLPQLPQEGDLLCMVNTAAYASDFEDASPHRLPTGKKFVVTQDNGHWSFCSEDQYWPI